MEDNKALKAKAAALESRVDFLETQFDRLNQMLVDFGFDEGIKTLAETLHEVMETEEIMKKRSE